jgi:endo-1,3(4)-beta-glucanase
MLPLTAISPYIRSPTFVKEEWDLYFAGKTGNIDDGWKGILYANYALINPTEAFKFFNQSSWQNKWLDGGASRLWYMAFAGGKCTKHSVILLAMPNICDTALGGAS